MTENQERIANRVIEVLQEASRAGLTVWEYGHSFFVATDEAYELGLEETGGETEYISSWLMENTNEKVMETRV